MRSITVVSIICLFIFQLAFAGAQNLIYNGGAEIAIGDTMPAGWTQVAGNWKSIIDTDGSYAPAEEGYRLFFSGKDSLGILQQDVNIASYSMAVDAQKINVIFNGFVRSHDQHPADQSRILVQCLDVSKTNVLFEFDSDTISSIGVWKEVADTFIAPLGTRFLRVQLIATRRSGVDNDGYFDNLCLYAVKTPNVYAKSKENKKVN